MKVLEWEKFSTFPADFENALTTISFLGSQLWCVLCRRGCTQSKGNLEKMNVFREGQTTRSKNRKKNTAFLLLMTILLLSMDINEKFFGKGTDLILCLLYKYSKFDWNFMEKRRLDGKELFWSLEILQHILSNSCHFFVQKF